MNQNINSKLTVIPIKNKWEALYLPKYKFNCRIFGFVILTVFFLQSCRKSDIFRINNSEINRVKRVQFIIDSINNHDGFLDTKNYIIGTDTFKVVIII